MKSKTEFFGRITFAWMFGLIGLLGLALMPFGPVTIYTWQTWLYLTGICIGVFIILFAPMKKGGN